MNQREVGELLRHIDAIYPGRIKLEPKTLDIWHFHLEEQSAERVMKRLKSYAKNNTFPPTIADLVDPPQHAYDIGNPLAKLARWEAEVSGSTTD